MFLLSCNSTAFGCGCRARQTRSNQRNEAASGISEVARKWCCWLRWGSGPMAVASERSWIGRSPMGKAKGLGTRMSHRLWERGVRPENGLQAVGSRWLW
jgi:hypothetical protein